MRKLILFALLLIAMRSVSQTPPSQFAGLMTIAADLTCAGVVPCSTWPMPANPGMGSSYTDPTWGTTTWELNIPSQNTSGASPGVVPCYSRVQSFSSDNKHLLMCETGSEYADLYDATTTPPTPINRITTTDGSWISPGSGDVDWAFTSPTRLYYIGGFQQTGALQLRYVDVTNCTSSNCVLTPTVVHTFSCTSDSYFPGGAGVAGNQIETGSGAQGGMGDATDTYFSFTCDYSGENGRGEIDFIRYNRSTDTVTTQKKWYTVCPGGVPSGCAVWSVFPGYNMIRMNQHPDQNYIEVIWQDGASSDSTWTVGEGIEYYSPTYTLLGPVTGYAGHNDHGYDVNGVPVWVGVNGGAGSDTDYYSIHITNLTTLSPTHVNAKEIYLPCTYAYGGSNPCGFTTPYLGARVNGSHVSMNGTWGTTPGYALYSTMILAGENGEGNVDSPAATTLGTAVSGPGVHTVTPGSMATIGVGTQQLVDYGSANIETVTVTAVTSTTFTATYAKAHTFTAPVSNLSAGDTGFGAMENFAVKIDTTAANGSTAQFWRLGRAMSIRDTDYSAEPHTTVNRDFTAYIWGSNWNVDGGADNGYYTKLSTSGAGGATSATEVSASAAPSPATLGQPVTLTATVTKTGSSVPTGSINFMNGSASLGEASLDSEGTATLALSWLPVGSYELTAAYSGDSNYATGESGSVPLQVLSPTTASLTASPNPVSAGQTLTLTATLTGDGSVWPAGTVSFLSGSALLGSATLNSSGVATLTTTSLAAGTYSLSVQYAGGSNFLSSTSATVSVTVTGQATTTTSLTATPNPVATGQTLTLTATVKGTGSTAPGGTVSFLSGSTPLGTAPVNPSGAATLTLTTLALGTYSVTAQYSGNANFLASTSAVVPVAVGNQATTTSLIASPNPVATGQILTLAATVQGTGSTTPGGTVSFLSGSTLLGTAPLNSSGVATLTTSSLAAGTYSLTAQYAGNANFFASTSAAASVAVNAQATKTTTSLTATPNPVATGQTLILTANVQGTGSTAPGGTVSFLGGSTPLGTATLNSSGVATLTLTTLAVGTYSVTAQYAGNANFLSSTSAAASVTVSSEPATTATSLTVFPNPVATGQTLTLTATVPGSGSTAPAGIVSFLSGSTPLGTAALNSSGVATLTLTTLAVGTYNLTAQYAGNASFPSSTSAAVSVTVSTQATTTSLTATPNPVTTGQATTLTATVQGSSAPDGSVSFLNGSTLLGTGTLNSSGVATLTTTLLAAGTFSLTAQYTGDANLLASTSAAVSLTVSAPVTTADLAFSLNTTGSAQSQTVQPGSSAVYTLNVSPAPGTTLPAITLTASGLPQGYTATFSPQTIAAGSGATNVTLSIQVPAQTATAMLERERKLRAGLSALAFCILLLPFGRRFRRSGKRLLQLSGMVLLLFGLASVVGLAGCTAPPGQFSGQNAQTYTVTVTTTSASMSQTANVTLIVE